MSTSRPVDRYAEAMRWRTEYEAGATVEQLALQYGHSMQFVRARLLDMGTSMRAPGERAGVSRLPHGGVIGDGENKPHLDPHARIVRPSVARWLR